MDELIYTLLEAPPATTRLPSHCVIVSYDVEACVSRADKKAVAGSAVALGGATFLYPELVPTPNIIAHGTFYRAIVQKVPTNDTAGAFFAQHPAALRATRLKPVEAQFAGISFVHWLWHVWREFHRPLALVAGPHSYDGAHLAHLLPVSFKSLEREIRQKTLQGVTWHDTIETVVAMTGMDRELAKKLYKAKQGDLSHIACRDSWQQGEAFCDLLRQ